MFLSTLVNYASEISQFVSRSPCYFAYNQRKVQFCRHCWHKQVLLCLSPTNSSTGIPHVSAQVSFLINKLCCGTKSDQVGMSIFNSKLLPKSTVLPEHCLSYKYQEKFKYGFEQRGREKNRDKQGMAWIPLIWS